MHRSSSLPWSPATDCIPVISTCGEHTSSSGLGWGWLLVSDCERLADTSGGLSSAPACGDSLPVRTLSSLAATVYRWHLQNTSQTCDLHHKITYLTEPTSDLCFQRLTRNIPYRCYTNFAIERSLLNNQELIKQVKRHGVVADFLVSYFD